MTPLSKKAALESYFFEARAKVLDLAAILDRIDRGVGDPADLARLARLRKAVEGLLEEVPGRAERAQQVFSLDYEAGWERPKPRF